MGYQLLDKNNNGYNEEDKIINHAKATAIKHLKDKYELDVEITEAKMLPKYIAHEVILEGNVIGSKEQDFGISVNYEKKRSIIFQHEPRTGCCDPS
ncbi:hypothetical protein [Paenibacillus sp. DMB20]|uniref:hypothetical protein n=1 Tax=Paenibacillus sp. DMB20 TaxID=1642570 RepID=UPI00069AAE3F|nr:hypothetical protein [Paenibacillus sp. DMB20]